MVITQTTGKNKRTLRARIIAAGMIGRIAVDAEGLNVSFVTADGETYVVQVTRGELGLVNDAAKVGV